MHTYIYSKTSTCPNFQTRRIYGSPSESNFEHFFARVSFQLEYVIQQSGFRRVRTYYTYVSVCVYVYIHVHIIHMVVRASPEEHGGNEGLSHSRKIPKSTQHQWFRKHVERVSRGRKYVTIRDKNAKKNYVFTVRSRFFLRFFPLYLFSPSMIGVFYTPLFVLHSLVRSNLQFVVRLVFGQGVMKKKKPRTHQTMRYSFHSPC